MSPVCSSRLTARCWLALLVLCVSGLWCHPVPEESNTAGAVSPLRLPAEAEELGQASDLADNDYPEMMTEFLRLTTTMATPASSTNHSNGSSSAPATLAPTTTTKTTTQLPNKKTFEIATAKFSPTTTTESASRVQNVTPASQSTVQTAPITTMTSTTLPAKSNQATVTAQQTVTGLALNPSKQQKVIPNQIKQMSVQKSSVPAGQQPASSVAPVAQQPVAASKPQQQSTPIVPVAIKQQVVNPAQQSAVFNQPQQQQMAVSTSAQQPNVVQTAASNGPRQPMFVPVPSQQQQAMANPAAAAQQPMMQNPAVIQQQQQQWQMMQNPFQQRLQQQAQAALFANSRQPVTNTKPVLGSPERPVYIRGGNGTPTQLIPIAAWPQYIQSISSNGIQMPSQMAATTA